jgi:hypothetical protein
VTRQPTLYAVSIGNGLFAQARRSETIGEAYRRLQRTCRHEKRDPNGTCYHCGHREPYEANYWQHPGWAEVFGD